MANLNFQQLLSHGPSEIFTVSFDQLMHPCCVNVLISFKRNY